MDLWYPKIFFLLDLVAYTDSDYTRASLDRKSTTGGCQFLGCRLISWQCKKQTVVANSTTKAEYVAASSCCRQVLWIQNQLLDYGYNFMHTKIFIDNYRKVKKSVRLMMEKIFGMELELILAKTINRKVQLHALVDGKKIIVIESTVRRDLQLEDAEGIDCLPNSTIFKELTRMGYEKISQKLTFYKAFFSPQWKFLIHTILQCLSSKTTAWNEFSSTMASAIICLATNQKFNFSKYIFESMVRNLDNLSGNFLMYPRKPKRKGPQVPQPSGPTKHVADKAVHKEMGDSLVRVATTASSLEAEEDSGNITKTRSKATPNKSSSLGTTSGGGPRCQETMGDTISQTRFENISKHSNDSLLARGNTLRSDGDSLKLNKLMELCTNLQSRVLDLEKTKTTQANEIASLKRRVKKLEKKRNFIDADEDITLVNDQDDADMFDVNTLAGEEVFVAEQSRNLVKEVVAMIDVASTIPISAATITDVEITLAQALAELKSAKPKADKDKGKGIMIEEPVVEQVKLIKRLELIRLDEELTFKLQAKEEEEEEEERLAREKTQQIKEANIA
ncbi:hypothetical protein Tco_0580292 [Tanacetum coccineum]